MFECKDSDTNCSDKSKNKELIYRDSTYLTLQINKGFGENSLDLMNNTFEKFSKTISSKLTDYSEIKDSVDELFLIIKGTKEFKKVRDILFSLKESLNSNN